MINLLFFLVVVVPIAWFASEFQKSRWLRLVLGTMAILMSFGVASIAGFLERIDANSYYGTATKDLVQNTIEQLEAGNTDRVIDALRHLRSKYHPSYETRSDYDKIVRQYVQRVSDQPIIHEPGVPAWRGRENE